MQREVPFCFCFLFLFFTVERSGAIKDCLSYGSDADIVSARRGNLREIPTLSMGMVLVVVVVVVAYKYLTNNAHLALSNQPEQEYDVL